MSAIEKRLHKKVPEMLDLFLTPLVSVLVAGFFSMTLIGPVFAQIESRVLNGAQALIAIPFGIGAFIMGGVYAPAVVAGVHHMYNAIEMIGQWQAVQRQPHSSHGSAYGIFRMWAIRDTLSPLSFRCGSCRLSDRESVV